MATIQAEYRRFLTFLVGQSVSDDVKRMANLVWGNLSSLATVGTQRRARSVRLVQVAIQDLHNTATDLPFVDSVLTTARTFERLHELTVGPFRGFTRPETFDLSQKITLVYGSNGTGKSSFCEALETAMLGSIGEARIKRIDHRVYCNNARLGRHSHPILSVSLNQEPPFSLEANEDDFRFCFVEKNRLDDFARIAARTPSDQRQLIATLFGVDQFSEFVRGFNPTLDENLNLYGENANQLRSKKEQLSAAEQIIRGHAARLQNFAIQEQALAERIYSGSTFMAICDWLNGTPQQQGRIAYLENVLDGSPPVIYNITQASLVALHTAVFTTYNAWQITLQNLAQKSTEVSYSQLYDAVLKLTDFATDKCPACGTMLDQVAENPYEKARNGLAQLQELANLQRLSTEQSDAYMDVFKTLHIAMKNALNAVSTVIQPEQRIVTLPILPNTCEGNWLQPWTDSENYAWNELLRLVGMVEQKDEESGQTIAQRNELSKERQRLTAFNVDIERIKAVREQYDLEVAQANVLVSKFEEDNRELIELVAAEGTIVEYHTRIKHAYDGYLTHLQGYLDSLPSQLLQGLGHSAKELYNAFNRDDPPADLLHALHLPVAENGKIELEFAGEQGRRYDALVILSEGHIKCLGLAILLAKNLTQDCPVVIFDDVVNAIDDDHRNGIWRTFFEDGYLNNKQAILTSHAEEFLLRIQQELGAARNSEIKFYKFLPHHGEHELRVDSNPSTKNYVLLAQRALASDDKRDALRHSRPALESLTDRLWTWLGKRGDGRLEIKLAGPRSPFELNNKCLKLRSALRPLTSQFPALTSATTALDSLLILNGSSIEWGYLNSGTHDSQRDSEFDRSAVRVIVEAVTNIDVALATLQHR